MSQFMQKISIKQRLIAAFAFIILLMASMSIMQLLSIDKLGNIVDKMHRHPLTVTRASALAYADALKIGLYVREANNVGASASQLTGLRQNIRETQQRARDHLSVINERILGAEGKALGKESTTLFERWASLTNQLLNTTPMGPEQFAQFKQQENELSKKFYEIVLYAENKGNGFYKNSTQSIAATNNQTFVILAIALLLGIGIAWAVFSSIIKPLNNLRETIEKIEKDSDLSGRALFTSHCEIGIISKRFNEMMKKLDASVIQARDAAKLIEQSNHEYSQQTQEIAKNITTQTEEVSQVAQAVTEMNQEIQLVAQNADATKERVTEANQVAAKSNSLVKVMAEDMDSLSSSSDKTTGMVVQLQQDTSAIDSILEVIKSIAEQTNLLALNAAIEAARAGEQGRGFAVVADEVRTLAERTTVSTSEIQETIEKLQKGTNAVVSAIQSNGKMIVSSVTKADSVANEIKQIQTLMDEISSMNASMADSTMQQAQASQNVDQRIQTLSALSVQASDNTLNMQSQNAALLSQSQALTQSMHQFKVSH